MQTTRFLGLWAEVSGDWGACGSFRWARDARMNQGVDYDKKKCYVVLPPKWLHLERGGSLQRLRAAVLARFQRFADAASAASLLCALPS